MANRLQNVILLRYRIRKLRYVYTKYPAVDRVDWRAGREIANLTLGWMFMLMFIVNDNQFI